MTNINDVQFESLPVNPTRGDRQLVYTSRYDAIRPLRGGTDSPHSGVDIRARTGDPVFAVSRGRVVGITSAKNAGERCGNGVIIEHDVPGQPKYRTAYCHLSTIDVRPNQPVLGGQRIGTAGSSVGSGVRPVDPHLHFTLRLGDSLVRVDPVPLLDRRQETEGRITRQPGQSGNIAYLPPVTITDDAPTPGGGPEALGITPYISSLKSFHPKIQYELMRRSLSSDMVSTHMPYVRLTSLTLVEPENLQDTNTVAWCPSLGVHGMKEVAFEDFYSTQSERSTVAYAYAPEGRRIPVVVSKKATESDAVGEPPNIPLPGIVSMKTERTTAGPMGVRGGLFRAKIMIHAYSSGQVDALIRYFLRPATRVVLEYGRMSTNRRDLDVRPYEWESKDVLDIQEDFRKLVVLGGTNGDAQRRFIRKYVYNNYGNYEIFIGYVQTFNLKYVGQENRYEIELTVNSVQQFEVPTNFSGARTQCPVVSPEAQNGKTVSIADYFRSETGKIEYNFDGLITKVLGLREVSDPLYKYKEHIVPVAGNSEQSEALGEKAYFISWEFFINVVLNDDKDGMMSVFQLSAENQNTLELLRSSIPTPIDSSIVYDTTTNNQTNLRQHFAGYHRALRSVDPTVMIISNPVAQAQRQQEFDALVRLIADDLQKNVDSQTRLDAVIGTGGVIGHFQPTDGNLTEPGVAPLSRGVWLNTNAIKQAFSSTDFVSTALALLLTKMNNASGGYWNLQLLSNDTEMPGVHVIDMTLSGRANTKEPPPIMNSTGELLSEVELQDKDEDDPKYLYIFNRKNVRGMNDDAGSESTNISIEFGLPLAVSVQAIAGIGGYASRGVMNLIDVEEIRRISLFGDLYPTCQNPSNAAGSLGPDTGKGTIDYSTYSKNALVIERLGQVFSTGSSQVPTFQNVAGQKREERLNNNQTIASYLKEYADAFGRAIRLIEYDKERMVNEFNSDAFQFPNRPHPFNTSNLTNTTIEVTLPGVGGIQLFQTFDVDKVPSILAEGLYTTVGVSHDFSVEKGWFTKIRGRYRYVPPES